jgi:phosphoglycolate phosphatase
MHLMFDLDLTLIDSTTSIHSYMSHAFKAMGLPAPTLAATHESIGMALKESFIFLTGNRDPEEIAKFERIFIDKAESDPTQGVCLFAETKALLQELKQSGARLSLITSKNRGGVDPILAHFELQDLFDEIICGDEVEHNKPDPQSINQALRQQNTCSAPYFYVGDSLVDCHTVKNHGGGAFFGVTTGSTTLADFAGETDALVVSDLGELRTLLKPWLEQSQLPDLGLAQQKVDAMVQSLGGYWQATSAFLRLVEEVAECQEARASGDRSQWSEELADLLIITCCLAGRCDVDLQQVVSEQPNLPSACWHNELAWTQSLQQNMGELARTINAVEGEKPAKPGENLVPVAQSLARIAQLVLAQAQCYLLPLQYAFDAKIDKGTKRDKHRFK